MIIAPSLLASDFLNLEKDVHMLNESQAEWLHLDVMDGRFVPNISFGVPVCASIASVSKKWIDVHLMIVEPEKYLSTFRELGADSISVHIEACPHMHSTLSQIHALGAKAGIAVNPHTPVSCLEDVLYLADYVCLMSVNPGFGGQKFIEHTYKKVEQLKARIDKLGLDIHIQIDGGVAKGNAKQLCDCGADNLVMGSSVFKAQDPKNYIKEVLEMCS